MSQPHARALPVTLRDLELVLQSDRRTANAFLVHLRRQTLKELSGWIFADSERERHYYSDVNRFARLYAMLKVFAPECLIGRDIPQQYHQINEYEQSYRQVARGDSEWMDVLTDLVCGAGFDALYMLVDGVDQIDGIGDDAPLIAAFLAPLLNAPILHSPRVAFKFFLPAAVFAVFQEQRLVRLDRAPYMMLEWNSADLCALISRRLSHFSQRSSTVAGGVRSFDDLCVAPFPSDPYLADLAGRIPRQLLALCEHIVRGHCASCDDINHPIDLLAVLERFPFPRPTLATAPPVERKSELIEQGVGEQPILQAAENVLPLLYYDEERGDVWLGEHKLDIILSYRRRLCLKHLWQNRHRIVTHEELINATYYDKQDTGVNPQQNLSKIIAHLRQMLEPGSVASDNYIEDVPGIGYRLRNYRA
jgi:DNA-binding response OmpR family regulator